MPAKARAPHLPRTQEQRSAGTRDRILDATTALLVEVGYARTSTWAVCERAGTSRGALLHHFPTRLSLMVAAVDHLARAPLDQLDDALAQTAPREQIEVFLSWLWGTATGNLFAVGLELLTAARTEPQLQDVLRTGGDVLQQRLESTVHRIIEGAGHPAHGALRTALLMSIPMVRGIGLDLSIGGNVKKHRHSFDRWRRDIAELTQAKD